MHTFLVLAAIPVAFFVTLFAGGALVGVARLGIRALCALGSTQEARPRVTLAKPVEQPARPRETATAEPEPFVEVAAICAPA